MQKSMKKKAKTVFGLSALVLLALTGMACPADNESKGDIFATPDKYRTMVSFSGATVSGSTNTSIDGTSDGHGVFIYGRGVSLQSFKIAKYETTYELWEEVRLWAAGKGYIFSNLGKEGFPHLGAAGWGGSADEGTGTDSSEWTADQKKTRPVTCINWRDAIVWCNAYSEMSGKTPVYYTDDTYSQVLKESSNNSGTSTMADTAVMKTNANGYRLPREAEWEYAARGGLQNNSLVWNFTYAGTSVVGTGTGQLGDYAWYRDNSYDAGNTVKDYGAHPVGARTPNTRALHDMSGNVWEWCWDKYDTIQNSTPSGGPSTGIGRVLRGGSWDSIAAHCTVAWRHHETPENERGNIGFRVVCP
jgi:formylglycine-generating enzyme required for sulfatase activity